MRKKISQIPDNLTPEEHIADERQPVPIVPIPPEEEANVAAELPVSQTEPVAPPPEPVAAPEEPPAMPPVVPMGGQPLVPPPVVPVGGQPLIPPPFVPVGQPPIPGGQIPRPPYVSPPPAPPYPGAYNFPKPPFAVAFDEASAGANQSGLLAVIVFLFSVCYAELLVRTGLFLWNGVGFGIAVITALFYVAFTGIILRGGKKVKASSFLPLIPLAMLLFTFCINSSMWGRNIGIAAAVFLFIWQTTLMSGATNHPAFSFRAVGDALRTHFSYPLFSNMGASLKVAFGGGKKKDEKNNVPGRILAGLFVSIPVVILLLVVFSAADAVFADMVKNFLSKIGENIGPWIVSFIIGAVLFFYFLPLVLTLRAGYAPPARRDEHSRWIDHIFVTVILLAVSAVFLFFSWVQVRYLFSMANPDSPDWMPGNMTLASYSRSGAYEMFTIVCVTVLFVLLINRYVKQNQKGRVPAPTKLALTILILCNFIIIASSANRLIKYIDNFSLTEKRLIVLIFIGMVALYLLIIVIRLWVEKLPAAGIMVTLAIFTAVVLSGVNVNAVVANYNTERYLSHKTTRIDIGYLGDLSCPAAPALDRLIEKGNADDARKAELQLGKIYSNITRKGEHITSWTWDRQVAKGIIEKHGIGKFD